MKFIVYSLFVSLFGIFACRLLSNRLQAENYKKLVRFFEDSALSSDQKEEIRTSIDEVSKLFVWPGDELQKDLATVYVIEEKIKNYLSKHKKIDLPDGTYLNSHKFSKICRANFKSLIDIPRIAAQQMQVFLLLPLVFLIELNTVVLSLFIISVSGFYLLYCVFTLKKEMKKIEAYWATLGELKQALSENVQTDET